MKEVRKRSLRDFHRTHPSGSVKVTKKPTSVEKIKPIVTSEGTGDKPGVLGVTKDDLTKSKTESWGNYKDDNNDENDSKSKENNEEIKSDDDKTPFDNENGLDFEQDTDGSESDSKSDQQEYEEEVKDNDDEVVHSPSNSDDEDFANLKSKNDDKIEGDEDRGMDDATNQFNDDVDARLNEPTQTDKEETIVLVASSSHLSELALKLLNFVDIHPNDAEIVSPLNVHVHHEVPSTHTSTILTLPVLVIPESSPVCTTIPQSSQSFTSQLLLTTPTPQPTIETTNTPSIIPDFALVFQFNERVNALEKEVTELKKDPLNTQVTALVDDHVDTRMGETREDFMIFLLASLTARITEQTVQSEEPEFEVGDTYMPQDQEGNLGPAFRLLKGTRSNYAELEYDFEECYKALLEKLDWENPEGMDYPFDLTKPLLLVKVGNHQKVPADYFFNNDLKYMQGGISTMTYKTSLTKTKAAHYDLRGIEDMVPNIWSPIKIALDRYAK
uniref:Uncharacterized protein n=1 Tax=Tanacetum cinerariifolium TaxID=118510 RepID=A0A6L2M5L0_TANCI|nr:hypothetical protein [Tanacetum cinerariifolium]